MEGGQRLSPGAAVDGAMSTESRPSLTALEGPEQRAPLPQKWLAEAMGGDGLEPPTPSV